MAKTTDTAPSGVHYIGAGRWLNGIPARDMSADEWGAIDPELRAQALALGLYEVQA